MDFPATFEEGGGGASEMDFPEIPEGGVGLVSPLLGLSQKMTMKFL